MMKMKLTTKLTTLVTGTILTLLAVLLGATGNASAASTASCLYQYNANGFNTSATPVFNSICGVDEGIGNEPDFVRIRQSTNGNDEDNQNNPNYSVGSISSACTTGTKYDLWNYVHNNASQNDNPDVGDGSAVAHNVTINMTAPLGTSSNKFTFGATISASNAASVSDTADLDCTGQDVTLSLVPSSVHIYSEPYGSSWQNLPDSSVNSTIPLGSTNAGLSSMGSGDQWGCWTYRMVIIYQVEVTAVTPPVSTPPTCNYITADEADIQSVNYTANSATDIGFIYNLYQGSSASGTPIATSGKTSTNGYHFTTSLNEGQTYTVSAAVTSSNFANATSSACTHTFTTATPTTPPNNTVTPAATTPTTLVNTGPGSTVAIFAGASAIGSGIYYWLIRRHLAKK